MYHNWSISTPPLYYKQQVGGSHNGFGVGTETFWCPVAQLQLCHLVHLTRLEIKNCKSPHNRNSTSPTGTKAAVAVECMFNMMVLASVSVRTRTPVKRAIGEYPTLG